VDNQTVTDLSYLREMAMGDETIIIETTEIFLEDTPQALENLQEHFANQEWDKLARLAHKIKPNLAYMGMDRARELIIDIEEQAQDENISDDIGDQIKEFKQLCNRALDELADKINKLKA
jgi:HPt (histidine-containing phosphotransfer) domain-containing protein